MGIDISWKKKIENAFTWPEYSADKFNEISVVIDDISLNLRRLLNGIDKWADLGARIRARVEIFTLKGTLKEYRMLIDESEYVPKNKGVTQRARDERGRADPFSAAEQQTITVGVGDIPAPSALFFERLLATRSMHADLYAFLCAELSQVKLPTGVRLVLEGFRARGIMARQMAGAPVLIMNIMAPDAGNNNALAASERARLDSTGRIVVSRSGTVPGTNAVFVHPSLRIGESDLKIAAAIVEQEDGAQIFVRSCDTDMLAILLLHMRNFIKDRNIRYGICLDTEGPGRKSDEPVPLLDMVELWARILLNFRTLYPTVPPSCAIETFAMLMLMSGSDYADRMPQVGAAAVWDAFAAPTGRDILFPRDRPNEPAILTDNMRGQPHARDRIQLAEARVFRFVAYMYHVKTMRLVPFPATSHYSLDAARKVRIEARAAVRADPKKKETQANSWQVPSDSEIAASVRRLAWNLDYFVNGSKPCAGPFHYPFSVDADSGKSIYGWVVTDENIADKAESVHIVG